MHTKVPYIDSLTAMRGIAALWVVLFHIDVSLYYRDLGALLPRTDTGIFSRGYLWVDFFFLLSGFVIAHVYGASLAGPNKVRAIGQYLWARFTRLYPLHLFTLAVLIIFSLAVPALYPQVIDGSWQTYFAWSAIPSQLMFTNAMNQHVYLSWNIVSWSIGAEWWTYVLALGLIIGLHKRSLWLVSLGMFAAAAGLSYLVMSLPEHNLDITFNYGFFRCLCEFTLGLGLYQFYRQQLGQRWLARDASFVLLCLGVIALFHLRLFDLFIIPIFAALILACAYNRARIYQLLNSRPLTYLGEISYSIYLVHAIWFMVFWFWFPSIKTATGMDEIPGLWKLAYVISFVSLTLICAHFTYHWIEVGCRQFLRKRFRVQQKITGEQANQPVN